LGHHRRLHGGDNHQPGDDGMTDDVKKPDSHREIDDAHLRRTTKAYSCTCAAHQQPHCSYWRMGYCSDKWNGTDVPPPGKPRVVVNNRNVYTVDFKVKQ
jgi:hypothetical protein